MSKADTNLTRLYRRFTRSGNVQSLPQPDTLLALVDGEHSADTERLLGDVARSGMHADLLRFARALTPESARLGVRLEQVFESSPAGHRHERESSRHAAGRRGWLRMATSIAACLLAAVAVWSVQQRRGAPAPGTMTAASTTAAPDRIFAAVDDAPQQAKSDEIFHGAFKEDRIFRSKFNRG